MKRESKYEVTLLSDLGSEIGTRPAENLKEAKSTARYMMSDAYATLAETTHATLRTEKVEIRDLSNEVVWDAFKE